MTTKKMIYALTETIVELRETLVIAEAVMEDKRAEIAKLRAENKTLVEFTSLQCAELQQRLSALEARKK